MPPKYYKKKWNNKMSGSNNERGETIVESFSNKVSKYLIIVESPSKCKKIEDFLGSDYQCIASKGHLRYIENLKSIEIKGDFNVRFSIIEEKKDHLNKMKSIIEKYEKSNIILATDDDREGEAIAWHICDIFDLSYKTTTRISFHEITKSAILHAIENPGKINMNLVYAQKARQILDMIVGFTISPLLWKYLYYDKKEGLSAGRCQTPALRLVYDNATQKNNVEKTYKTTGYFFSQNIAFSLNHDFLDSSELTNFLEKTKTHRHKIKIESARESKSAPPNPFNTSSLLQIASNNLHYSPGETMAICQILYQNGHITYMRTENTKYSAIFLEQAREFILGEWKDPEYLGDLTNLISNENTNPHEAIRVTHIEIRNLGSDMDTKTQSLYRLIWKNTVESCMSDARYSVTPCKISTPLDYYYLHTIETPLFLGWKKVMIPKNGETQNENSLLMFFQSLIVDSEIKYNYIESVISVKGKTNHFSEASLIKKLEEIGIGRPSTFASIVETIIDRGYVKKQDISGEKIECIEYLLRDNEIEKTKKEKVFGNEKNKLVIQPTGIMAVEFLQEHFMSIFSYNYTESMEKKLDIVDSEKTGIDICKECLEEINNLCIPLAELKKQVFSIGSINPLNEGKYDIAVNKNGYLIRERLGEGFVYHSIKQGIKLDMDILRKGEYNYEDLIEIQNDYLGEFEGKDMYIKIGKYGPYVQWGNTRESIQNICKPLNEITLTDVETFLMSKRGKNENDSPDNLEKKRLAPAAPKTKNTLRVINQDLSIRRGEHGFYIFYQTIKMKKPKFFPVNQYTGDIFNDDDSTILLWIKKTFL